MQLQERGADLASLRQPNGLREKLGAGWRLKSCFEFSPETRLTPVGRAFGLITVIAVVAIGAYRYTMAIDETMAINSN